MKTRISLFVLLCLISQWLPAQTNWQKIQTVEDVCVAYPDQIKSIFLNLNLDYQGLEAVKKAYEANDIPLACQNLLTYYGKSNNIKTGLNSDSDRSTTGADSILNDIYSFQVISDKVPRLADGHLKWDYTGPQDDIEWAWALNRHYTTGSLLAAYGNTKDPKYAKYINDFTKDWITSSWPYPAKKSNTAMWRGLEVSFRVKVWSQVFFQLWNIKLISPATQLLILSSLPDHAHYARNFHAQGNWLTMEISGLATVASSWPEFKESKAWMDYAIQAMVESMKEQVYPDGVQTELTSSYHHVALSNFNLFAGICNRNNVPLPEYYTKTLEAMWNYLATTMRPDGYGILNNDADLENTRRSILNVASTYNRPDWTYIATNGKEVVKPNSNPSYIFPWAGQLISRSGFDGDAQYSFFDIGPWGSGHQHNDKLNLTITAYGRDLIVDGGRFAYRGEVANKFRKYATGSQSHNVILVDGKGQADGQRVAKEPLSENLITISKDFDYGSGTFDKYVGLEGTFSQTRSVVYVRGKFWVVVDQLKTDRPRNIEALWHWHPANQVKIQKSGIATTKNDRGNLMIIPVGTPDWKVDLVKGQETPTIQGWYSKVYNTFEPNPTTIYSRQLKADDTFVWILWPSEGKDPNIRTEILSKNANSIKVRVSDTKKRHWDITVPFADSAKAEVKFGSR